MTKGARVEQSRAIPVTPEQAFRGIIEMDVPIVFRRRYGLIPPIRRVSGRDGANWGGTVGQTRILELGGGGSIRETVVSVDEPHSWTYAITDLTGPLAVLLEKIDGQFLLRPIEPYSSADVGLGPKPSTTSRPPVTWPSCAATCRSKT
jgi:Polyketide cyclase / dehydrase and lipid transport